MTKTYKANTVFSCTLPSGRHVRFLPHSYGGSRLTTADASLQRELEASGMMGREYWLMETREAPQAPAAAAPAEVESVTACDLETARDLLEQHGVARSKTRTRAAILQEAERVGINLSIS